MGKILAIIFLVVFVWFAIPHFARAQWIAPTAIYPDYWGNTSYTYSPRVARLGYGWFRFDFWNRDSFTQATYVSPSRSTYYTTPTYYAPQPAYYYDSYQPAGRSVTSGSGGGTTGGVWSQTSGQVSASVYDSGQW